MKINRFIVACPGAWRGMLLSMVLFTMLGACGSGATPPPSTSSDPSTNSSSPESTGEAIFNDIVLERNGIAVQGCIACHAVDPAIGDLVGPNLAGIATRATERVPGITAEEYLRTSILDPAAYTVEGFDPSTKPMNYGELLTDADLDSLIAYLMTLE